MRYTVQQLADLAGVSARTLRWYDKVGLLCPTRAENGYRVYDEAATDRLQQILFYRALGFQLSEIKPLLKEAQSDRLAALCRQRQALQTQLHTTQKLIETVEKTITSIKEGIPMSDQEKFEGFKKQLVKENEQKYGAEVRQKYGDAAADDANRKMMGLSEADYARMSALGTEILTKLTDAVSQKADPAGETGTEIAQLHKQWLAYTWNFYAPEAHAALAEGYVADERFAAYYNENACPGAAAFLRDAIVAFCKG